MRAKLTGGIEPTHGRWSAQQSAQVLARCLLKNECADAIIPALAGQSVRLRTHRDANILPQD
jgi:hypothetical protein